MLSINEPSALLSDARLTIAALIQRPSTITTSNAFDEFSVLDQLIDVSNDVDRFEGGESRKFLNIAQLITASTCIYSRRVDALYKLINNFHSTQTKTEQDDEDEMKSDPILEQEIVIEKRIIPEKKKKITENNRSFICQDLSKINYNSTKTFFLDRTSLFDLKLFQKYLSINNKQFWSNDHRPIIFDLLFNDQVLEQNQAGHDELFDTVPQSSSPEKSQLSFQKNDIPLPIPMYDDEPGEEKEANDESLWNNHEKAIEYEKILSKKKLIRNRRKKILNELDLNLFRHDLTDDQQALFRLQKFKSSTNKIKTEQTLFFSNKNFTRKHFDALIKGEMIFKHSFESFSSILSDCSSAIFSTFTYPIIAIHYYPIRERYSMKINQFESICSPPIPITDVFNNDLSDRYSPTFIDDNQEDVDIRLQTDMEHILDAAFLNSNEEQEHNKIFLELRTSITNYMNEHQSNIQTNFDDLLDTFDEQYSLPLVFSQLLHLCGSTQRYYLHSTANDTLFIEKIH